MSSTVLRPRGYSRVGLLRRWWHRRLGHLVFSAVVRDYRPGRAERFCFRRGWYCATCQRRWP